MNAQRSRAVKVRTVLFCIALAAACLIFFCTAIRALTTNLTDDEAYTYINYVRSYRPLDPSYLTHLFHSCKANNHWLNTFLIWVMTQILGPYSEAAVRLPNLIFFAAYLAACLFALRKRHISFLCCILLMSNYYLNEFFGLGRGYGMAAAFVLFTLLLYGRCLRGGCRSAGTLLALLLCLALGAASNTVVLLLYPSVGLLLLYRMIQERTLGSFLRRHAIGAILFLLISVILVQYHLGISRRDTALYVGTGDFFHSVVKEYLGMIVTNRLLQAALLLSVTAACVLSIAVLLRHGAESSLLCRCHADGKENLKGTGSEELLRDEAGKADAVYGYAGTDYFVMLLLFVAVNLLSGVIFRKGYITGRTTLPFWPLVVLGLSGLYRRAAEEMGILDARWFRIFVPTAAAVVLLLLARKTHLTTTRDWPWDYGTRERVEQSVKETGIYRESDIRDYTDVFYMAKYGLNIDPYLGN